MSCIEPFCHRNARVCVPKPNKELASGVEFEKIPVICPELLIPVARLSYPPSSVPRLNMLRPIQTTAFAAGNPVTGSRFPVVEIPTATPESFTHDTLLLLTPGNAPRSVTSSLLQRKPCSMKGSWPTSGLEFGKLGSGVDVLAQPTSVPWLFNERAWPKKLKLEGPPKVPITTSLYRK